VSTRYTELCDIVGPVSRETFDELSSFEEMFLDWSSRLNLVASSTREALWGRHILDSAQLWPLAPSDTVSWLDLGSGGGFPGLILAFLLKGRLGGSITLVDSNRKKTAFLQNCVGAFSLPAKVYSTRIVDLALDRTPQIVTSRALAALPELLTLSEPWLGAGAIGLFHKGRDYRREVEESAHGWLFDLVEHRSKIDPQGVILEVRNLARRREQ
jgi:16S rRNA (guanine527-N7)-methyltransferase